MTDAVRQLEALKQRVAQINTRIARAEALRQVAARNHESAKLEAELEFGTADPEALEKLAESARKDADALITQTAAALDEAERQLSIAEKALQQ